MHLSERMPATRVETHVRVRHILEQWDPVKDDGIPCHSSIPLFAIRAGGKKEKEKREKRKEERGKNSRSLLARMRVPSATTARASNALEYRQEQHRDDVSGKVRRMFDERFGSRCSLIRATSCGSIDKRDRFSLARRDDDHHRRSQLAVSRHNLP
jgi:hypothetical protein